MSTPELLDSIANSLADAVVELKKQTMLLEKQTVLLEQLHSDNDKKIEVILSAVQGGKSESIREPAQKTTLTISDVQKLFPEKLQTLLVYEQTAEYIKIKPRQYLGSDDFKTVAAIVREKLGGEYVSAGRDSHFRIPRR